jgi:hypothetical protein
MFIDVSLPFDIKMMMMKNKEEEEKKTTETYKMK